MEIIIRPADGNRVEIGFAEPGFDATKWPTSEKYWFTLSKNQAARIGVILVNMNQNPHSYIITEHVEGI